MEHNNKIKNLTDKIYREGIEKANEDAELIISESEEKAAVIIDDATKEADRILDQAEKEALNIAERMKTELRLSSQQSLSLLRKEITELIKNHYDDETANDPGKYEKILAEGYYQHVMKTGTPFLKKITEFDYNMNNLLVTLQTGKHNLFQNEVIVGANSLANYL